MVYNDKFEDVKGKRTILIVSNCVLFVLQLTIVAFFAAGLIECFGISISVTGAIEMLLSIFNIAQGAIFEYLFKFALGIYYVVAMIIVIKNVIVSISYFVHGVFDKNEAKANRKKEVMYYALYGYFGDAVKHCFIFISFCLMTSVDFKITLFGKVVLILGLIVYIIAYTLRQYLKNFNFETIVYKSLATVIMATAFVLLALNLNIASFEQVILGLRTTFGGYFSFADVSVFAISFLAVSIIYIFGQCYLISYLSDMWEYEEISRSIFSKAKAKIIMGISIAIVVISAIMNTLFGNLAIFDIYVVYNILTKEIITLLASIVLFVSFKFAKFEEKRLVVNQVKVEDKKEKVEIKTEEVAVKATTKESSSKDEIEESSDLAVELTKYKDLLEKGLITQEEYAETKKKILGI